MIITMSSDQMVETVLNKLVKPGSRIIISFHYLVMRSASCTSILAGKATERKIIR